MTEIIKVLKFKIRILFKIHNSKFSSKGGSLPAGRQAPPAEKFIFGIASPRPFVKTNFNLEKKQNILRLKNSFAF